MVYLKEKKHDFWKSNKLICLNKMLPSKWSSTPMKFQDVRGVFIETLSLINLGPDINKFKLQISDSFELTISFLQDCFGI